MQVEPRRNDRVRVIGSLTARALELLLEMVGNAQMRLDLSEVREADADAVRLLAQLAPDQFDLVACPRWLAFRIQGEARPQAGGMAVENAA